MIKERLWSKRVQNILKCGLNIVSACIVSEKAQASQLDVLFNQLLDSLIVGGIAGISAYVSSGENISFEAAVLGFLLTFLIKMKEYRKIE